MPKGSRRLPGGKVRKPLAQRPRSMGGAGTAGPAVAGPAVREAGDEIGEIGEVGAAPATPLAVGLSPARAAAAPVRPAPPARPAPAARAPAIEPRRVGVGARRAVAPAGTAPRRSTSLMELAAANYGHIRADLARIGVLAVIMLAIIVALSFVLK
jgi:hypothetical protein